MTPSVESHRSSKIIHSTYSLSLFEDLRTIIKRMREKKLGFFEGDTSFDRMFIFILYMCLLNFITSLTGVWGLDCCVWEALQDLFIEALFFFFKGGEEERALCPTPYQRTPPVYFFFLSITCKSTHSNNGFVKVSWIRTRNWNITQKHTWGLPNREVMHQKGSMSSDDLAKSRLIKVKSMQINDSPSLFQQAKISLPNITLQKGK